MCGRNSVNATKKEIAERYSSNRTQSKFKPSYNVAPGNNHPIIREGSTVLEDMEWNFIPEWAEDYSSWKNKSIINARIETVQEKKIFKEAFDQRKALIPSTGFYEWKKEGKNKQPYRIKAKNQKIFSLAGFYTKYEKDNTTKGTFVILTKEAEGKMREIHEREPVYVPKNKEKEWIRNRLDKETLLDRETDFVFEKVSKAVNNPANDSKEILTPDSSQSKLDL